MKKSFSWRRFSRRRRRSLTALAGGGVSALALPPTDLYPMMIVGLGLLAWALQPRDGRAPRFWSGFGYGLAWGTGGHLVGMRFVPSVIQLFTDLGVAVSLLAHLLLSMAQSLHWALSMGLAVVLMRRLRAPLELAFATGITIALMIPTVFVWTPAGLLSPWPMLVQAADLVGERGVSAVFGIVAALLARAFTTARSHGLRDRAVQGALSVAGGIVILLLGYGAWAMDRHAETPSSERARVALVHAAVDPRYRWEKKNWAKILWELKQQTAIAETAGVDLTIWPEAAYPYQIRHDDRRVPRGARSILGGAVEGPILFGYIANLAPRKRDDGTLETNRFNAATVVEPDGDLQPSYDKMELLWFGEMVPLGQYFPALRRLFHRSGGLIPGDALRGLTSERPNAETLRMGVLNCYEDTLPDHGRRIMRELAPNLLVNVTNDAWFVGTVERELHMRLSVMRSIELRRDMVRAVNLGVAAWVDATGVVRARNDSSEPGYLLTEPTLRTSSTIYGRLGDWPFLITLGASMIAFGRRKSRRDGAADPRDAV